jgi:hypothetical protein
MAGIVLATLVTCQPLIGQSSRRTKAQPPEYVEDLRKRPDLGSNYAQVAKFKLASRKATYRVGEMITIDVAIMNVSDAPVFLHKLNRPSLKLKAQDRKGASVSINDYYTVLEGVAPQSFRRIEAGHILFESFQLLAGCDDANLKARFEASKKLEEEEHGGGERVFFKGLFERDLFVNFGQSCFSANTPGTYTITAEQSNDTVVVSSNRPKVKSAVGTIRSTPLTLTIIE